MHSDWILLKYMLQAALVGLGVGSTLILLLWWFFS